MREPGEHLLLPTAPSFAGELSATQSRPMATFDRPRTPERAFPTDFRAVAPSFAPGSTHTPPAWDVRETYKPQVNGFTEIESETRFSQK
jgi:hypothetical protein